MGYQNVLIFPRASNLMQQLLLHVLFVMKNTYKYKYKEITLKNVTISNS